MAPKRFFFPLFLILIVAIPFGAMVPSALAQEGGEDPINDFSDQFTLTLTPSYNLPEAASKFRTEVSKVSVANFRNEGLLGSTSTSVTYYAEFELEYVFTVYSYFDANAVSKEGLVTTKNHRALWLYLVYIPNRAIWWERTEYAFYANAPELSYTYQPAWMDGLDLNISYNALSDTEFTFAGEGIETTSVFPTTEVTFHDITVEDVKPFRLGNYTDIIQNANSEVSLGSFDFTSDSASTAGGDAKAEVQSKLNQLQLGMHASDPYELTVQQRDVVPTSPGSNIKLGSTINHAETSIPTFLKPGFTEIRQDMKNRHTYMQVDPTDGAVFKDAGIIVVDPVQQDTWTRPLALSVENWGVKYTIHVRGRIVGTLPFSEQTLSDAFLSDPTILRGDYYWEGLITGTTSVDLVFTEAYNGWDDFWSWFGGAFVTILIVVIGVIVVVWALYTYVPKAFQKSKAKRQRSTASIKRR